jgi:hypothetical protein
MWALIFLQGEYTISLSHTACYFDADSPQPAT